MSGADTPDSDGNGASGDATHEGTTDEDYRWRWLATVFTGGYGLGYPLITFTYPFVQAPYPGAGIMAPLTLGWLACVVYIVGPENIKVAKSLRE